MQEHDEHVPGELDEPSDDDLITADAGPLFESDWEIEKAAFRENLAEGLVYFDPERLLPEEGWLTYEDAVKLIGAEAVDALVAEQEAWANAPPEIDDDE